MALKTIKVSDLIAYLKEYTESNSHLKSIRVSGELSNVRKHNGILYFDVKDDLSKLNGIMFSNYAKNMFFEPVDGDKVIIDGSIKVYDKNALFQINATNIEKNGIGQMFLEFEKNKKYLQDNGYFDLKHKKKLNLLPKKIAIICGNESAALHDILKTINTRNKLVQVVVFPTLVQGNNASKKIVENINLVNKYEFDTIILARGGGSFEDLNCFNHMDVVMAIFNSKIPIITGIGHESDTTLSDYVSDLRALTPTDASNKVMYSKDELNKRFVSYTQQLNISLNKSLKPIQSDILEYHHQIKYLLNKRLNTSKEILNKNKLELEKRNIKYKINIYHNKLYELNSVLQNQMKLQITSNKYNFKQYHSLLINNFNKELKDNKQKLNELIIKLNLLDPKMILDKGYAIVYQDNQIIKDYSQLELDSEIEILGSKNTINAIIKGVK